MSAHDDGAAVQAVRGRPGAAELVALLVALDTVDPEAGPSSTDQSRRPGRWNDPAAGLRPARWAHDLSPRRYGRTNVGSTNVGGVG